MKERPIIFNAPMIRALLSGAKTQTRRLVKPQTIKPPILVKHEDFPRNLWLWPGDTSRECPYGQPGDRLWVRETWADVRELGFGYTHPTWCEYRATVTEQKWNQLKDNHVPWRPSIHMPRWASRITLEITSVRVERVQEISEVDAKAEGAPLERAGCSENRAFGFQTLWDSIYAEQGLAWDINPWVWVIEFKVHRRRSDA